MELNDTTNDATLDNRLTNLEVKATYNEDLLEQLEQVIIKQQQQIDAPATPNDQCFFHKTLPFDFKFVRAKKFARGSR